MQATVAKVSQQALMSVRSYDGVGGSIRILGERVALFDDTLIDVSGMAGGGEILIGGDIQGANEWVMNAQQTYVGVDTVLRADALEVGNGGKVIVWADDTAQIYGSIFARGGSVGGDGSIYIESFNGDINFLGAVTSSGNVNLQAAGAINDGYVIAKGSLELLANQGVVMNCAQVVSLDVVNKSSGEINLKISGQDTDVIRIAQLASNAEAINIDAFGGNINLLQNNDAEAKGIETDGEVTLTGFNRIDDAGRPLLIERSQAGNVSVVDTADENQHISFYIEEQPEITVIADASFPAPVEVVEVTETAETLVEEFTADDSIATTSPEHHLRLTLLPDLCIKRYCIIGAACQSPTLPDNHEGISLSIIDDELWLSDDNAI